MVITIFKIFILGGKWSYIMSEFSFTALLACSHRTTFSDCKSDDIPPQMKILNKVIPKFKDTYGQNIEIYH